MGTQGFHVYRVACVCFVELCVSPSPVNPNGETGSKREAVKRHAEDVIGTSEPTLSRNKLKKLRRNAAKSFVPKADKFEKCGTCGNPKVCLAASKKFLLQNILPV